MKQFYLIFFIVLLTLNSSAQVFKVGTNSFVFDVSNNGEAVGVNNIIFTRDFFMWSREHGLESIGSGMVDNFKGGICISPDGSYIAASILNPITSLETAAILNSSVSWDWEYLPGFGKYSQTNTESYVLNISENGKYVTGAAFRSPHYEQATVWNENNQPILYGSGEDSSRASDITPDGRIIVGSESGTGAVYWENGETFILKDHNEERLGGPQSISYDGRTIVGNSGRTAYIWTKNEETIFFSHPLPEMNCSITSVSGDGNIAIVGCTKLYRKLYEGDSYIWIRNQGFFQINEFINDLGYDTLGLELSFIAAVSRNGKYLGGIAIDWDLETYVGIVIELDIDLAVDGPSKTNEITVYPNPVTDLVSITSNEIVNSVEVFNLLGQKMMTIRDIQNNQLDVSSMESGVYILKAISNSGFNTTKIIKK